MTDQPPPKIEFPCSYPIKVMGDAASDFPDFVVAVMTKHAGDISEADVSVRESSKGTFLSVTVTITATGVDQLTLIHEEFKLSSRVKMVM
jgi:putative lipoic acid-binding regulatory protein